MGTSICVHIVAVHIPVGSPCENVLQCGLNTICTGSSQLACQCVPFSNMDMNGIDCLLGWWPIGGGCSVDGECGGRCWLNLNSVLLGKSNEEIVVRAVLTHY